MTIAYSCGNEVEVYSNNITKHDAIITVAVSSSCAGDRIQGPQVLARKQDGSESHRKRLPKPGGVDSFTVEEGGKAFVQCEGTGLAGCSVEVTVNSVKLS